MSDVRKPRGMFNEKSYYVHKHWNAFARPEVLGKYTALESGEMRWSRFPDSLHCPSSAHLWRELGYLFSCEAFLEPPYSAPPPTYTVDKISLIICSQSTMFLFFITVVICTYLINICLSN